MVRPQGESRATELRHGIRGKSGGFGLGDLGPRKEMCRWKSQGGLWAQHRKNFLTLRTALSGKGTSVLFGQ